MRRRILLLALLVLTMLGLVPSTPASAQSETRCFPETGYCISGAIRAYWERNGGLPVFGYPTGPVTIMTIENWTGPAQWFERDRLEDHANQSLGVLAGRLGAERLEQQGRPWVFNGNPSQLPGCRLFPETGYNLCGAFRSYWERNGGLERFGYPITTEMTETLEGRNYQVQYFERRRMELHPENQAPYDVLLGLLGNEVRNFTGEQPACAVAILNELQYNYREFGGQGRLGCPLPGQDFSFTQAAAVRFERGQMYWVSQRGGNSMVVVLFYEPDSTISVQIFEDLWRQGDPETGGLQPPAGKFEPRRGFGKVWREQPGVRDRLGWALETERIDTASFQGFQQGALLFVQSENLVWELLNNGDARSATFRWM